jgi:4-carboxymuconolactone decarboxylase
MDQETYSRGLTMRRKVLGEEYVDRALKSADDFNRDFQRIVTQYCWGETWGDKTLAPRERSILNLGMIAALGKMEEFATHVRGARRNGLSPDEIRAVLTQIAIYCGVPVGVDCFRIARSVLAESKDGNDKGNKKKTNKK